ncbi:MULTISPECIES: SAM-dependent methyltransferase [Frankia]|uniref:Restriction enzyme n=1 Tax=Frankia alni (strain DSM 45986 / CECT 9034 / ACN14a) TaxID=326424 RepID=Q0RIV7_FRAAA|nr:putative restriction enzyme [Frankia alni ACN14a]
MYLKVLPGIAELARASRGFLARSVTWLAAEAGIRQFLDVGTGLPTADNTHEVAQRATPDSRIVYVDNDPTDVPLRTQPAAGWGAVVDTAEAKAYAPEAREALRAWRAGVLRTPGKEKQNRLARLAQRVEVLWGPARRRLEIAEAGIRRATGVWGAPRAETETTEPGTREQVEAVLHDPNSAYRRLRLVMDAWCALSSWPLTTTVTPPDWDAWLGGLEALLGRATKPGRHERAGQGSFADDLSWRGLDDAEALDLGFADETPVTEATSRFPWLRVAAEIADRQGFFHWELDFPQVFARGGFGLQVGNPPWARPDWDEAGILAEHDPWWALVPTAAERAKKERRKHTFHLPDAETWYLDQRAKQAGLKAHFGSQVDRPLLHGLQPDLYRCFMDRTWRSGNPTGIRAAAR